MSTDYFGTFFTKDSFDFIGLLNADFFQPIRILFQNNHYVSSAKLLVIAIDSVGFIEYGDVKNENTFIKWLNTYSKLNNLGITAEELWEHRNSLLHMSSLDSRKVTTGKVRRLIAHVGELPLDFEPDETDAGYYNLQKLIIAFGEACGNWCRTYSEDREKIDLFVERYDLIVSDARMLNIEY
jgi:hypothetical protein